MKRHLEIDFFGQIKGLGLMQAVQDSARRLELTGYIKRLPTGTLHIEAEGEEDKLEALLNVCRAREEWRTDNNAKISENILGYDSFYIRKFG